MQPNLNIRRISGFVIMGAILLSVAATLVYKQEIQDYLVLRNYQPTSEIVKLADDTTMLDSSRRLFYVQKPFLADKEAFNTYCRKNEQSIVLGCFINGQGIFLLDVKDDRLAGVEEVTAGHELLHAAYERLSGSERSKIDQQLLDAYDNITNERLRQNVELYRAQDPSIVPNELHSILGTEVRVLPQELENYYKRYFADRSKIVTFSEQYEQAFIERRNAVRDYDNQLTILKNQVDSIQGRLEAEERALSEQRDQMNTLRISGQTAAFNALVPSFNQKVNSYNSGVEDLESSVAKYNYLVQKRNAVATEEAELVEAIDSREIVPNQQ